MDNKALDPLSLPPEAIYHYQEHAYDFVCDQILYKVWKDIKPTWQQKEALEAVSKYNKVGIRSGHGPGKDTLFSWIILWFLRTRPIPIRIPCTAPTHHQLNDILWPEISRWLGVSLLSDDIEWMATSVHLKSNPKGAFAVARSSKKSDYMQGFHADHLLWIIDEAFGILDPLIFEVIEGSCTQEDNKIIFGGNPTVISGYCHEAFNSDKRDWEPPGGQLFTWNAEESPIVNKDQIARIARKWGKFTDVYRVRVLGLPPKGNPDAFIQLTDIEKAVGREVEKKGKVVFGVDTARFGDDLTVIASRMGNYFFPLITKERTDEVEIKDAVLKAVRDFRGVNGADGNPYNEKIEIRIDTTGGYGAGAYDLLKRNTQDNIDVIPVNFGSGGNEEYKNATSIMWSEFRDGLKDISLPDDVDLIGELSTRRWRVVPAGGREKILIEPKAEYKTQFGQSPDRSDALMLCWTKQSIAKLVFPDYEYTGHKTFRINWRNLSDYNTLIASIWVEKDLQTSILIGNWNQERGKLYVFGEFNMDNPRPEKIMPLILKYMRLYSGDEVKKINRFEWFGNEEMFKSKTNIGDMRDIYRKFGVFVRENENFDLNGSILYINRLIFRDKLEVDPVCQDLCLQLQSWTVENGQPVGGYCLCRALLSMISALHETGKTVIEKPKIKPYTLKHNIYNQRIEEMARAGRLHEVNKRIDKGQFVIDTTEKDGWLKI